MKDRGIPPVSSNQIPMDDDLNRYREKRIVKIKNTAYEIVR